MKVSSTTQSTLLNTTVDGIPWGKQFQLGLGVDAVTGQLRASAVKPIRVEPSKVLKSKFDYSLIQAERDVQSMISGSVKGAYNLEGVTVSASTSFLDELKVSELSVTLLAMVSVEESQFSLASKYELSVQPGPDFRAKHGDYFIAGYRRGASLYAMYQCQFSSVEQRNKFAAKLAADVPQVMSAEGAAAFEKTTKECNANVNIHIATTVGGTLPSPPGKGWTPDTINAILLPWFNIAVETSMDPLEACLRHYCMIDPTISAEVAISPDVFSQLGFLYNRFWLVRTMFKTCSDFWQRLAEEPYNKLRLQIEANQASLPSDLDKIVQLTDDTQRLLQTLHEINNRQTFYSQAIEAAKTEPGENQRFDADKGRVRWSYGFQNSNLPGVEITSIKNNVNAEWKIGWNEHVFAYRDSGKVVVGWDIICNWSDGTGGDWEKRSDQIIGRSAGNVYVKSDYDRGYSWSIVWYVVDSNLYPPGPWTERGLAGAEFSTYQNQGAESIEALWTTERMAAASPIDRSITIKELPPVPITIAGGDANVREFHGSRPSEDVRSALIGPNTTPVSHPQDYPARTVGKLFFRMGGRDCVASAFVVERAGIMTAAHCLLLEGQQASEMVFIPAFQNGNAPFGVWVIDNCHFPSAWIDNQGPGCDVGFCTVRPTADGQNVGDIVGWVGIACGAAAGLWNNMGYPALAIPGFPFNGMDPWQSLGSRVECALPSAIAKHDNLTAGGSGGPWLMSENMVNGLFSQFDVATQRNISPFFGDWVGAFFHRVFG